MPGSGGNGEPDLRGRLNFPLAGVVEREGSLSIADMLNHRIRLVDGESGFITMMAGLGYPPCNGDGGAAISAGLHAPPALALEGNGVLNVVIQLSRPVGIAGEREGNVRVTDSDNHVVRRWNRTTGGVERRAGRGNLAYWGDEGSAVEVAWNYPFGWR